MTSTTNTISRLVQALVLAVALAAFAAPVALGDDPSDRPGLAVQTSQAETPDWFERAAARSSQAETPDWLERAAARHSEAIAGDKRLPDTIDAALLAQSRGSSVTQLDLRSPDTRDVALRTHDVVIAAVTGNAFDWGDFGFGVAASFGVLLLILLSAGILAVRGHRGGRIKSA